MTAAILVGLAAMLAQDPPRLAARVRSGEAVIVVDTSGRQTQGVVQAVSDTRLVVDYGVNDFRTFRIDEIDRVRRSRLWDGAVKGAAIALIPAVLSLLPECAGCSRAAPFAGMIAAGAAAGLAIDVANGPDTVYRRRTSRVAVRPLFGDGSAGVTATWRF